MRRRKLVHVISSLSRGGAEHILSTLCKELAHAPYHYEQTVLFFYDGPLRHELESRGIATLHITAPLRYSNPLFYLRLYRALSTLQPDIVHSVLWLANTTMRVMCTQLRVPVVCALHNLRELDGPVRIALDRLVPYHATRYCAVSGAVAQSYAHLPHQTLVHIPNGILEPVVYAKLLKKNCFIIGAVGRFVPSKNYLLLIRVFAAVAKQHSHARLCIVGHGPQELALKTLAMQLEVEQRVIFVIDKPAQRYYHLFDCFVHPSRSEGFGLSVAEAQAHGVPTIVTHDAHELHEALIAHLQRRSTTDTRKSENYTVAKMVEEYNSLFTQLACPREGYDRQP